MQCCLGVKFFNPNIAGEMAQLLMATQEEYVPAVSNTIVRAIALHGDQLFEERGRQVQWTFQDGDNDIDQLKGLLMEFADWHGKLNTYMVSKSPAINVLKIYIVVIFI